MTPEPFTPRPVASNPVLARVLAVGAIVTGSLAVIGAIVGFFVAGVPGLVSALIGLLLAAVFLGITAGSILFANRWNGDPIYPTLFYAIVLGGWLVKFVLFFIAMIVLKDQPWLERNVFFIALVVGVIATLVVDVVVMLKMRIPYVSDVDLPESVDEDDDVEGTSAERAARTDSSGGTPSSDS